MKRKHISGTGLDFKFNPGGQLWMRLWGCTRVALASSLVLEIAKLGMLLDSGWKKDAIAQGAALFVKAQPNKMTGGELRI